MSELSLTGIRTAADLRAEAAAPKPESDLDRNAFLRLFTTQLQNQNPLDPMKNEAFVAQLAQFSSLEATTRMSDSLDQFVSTQSSEKIMRGASLIGKNIFASGAVMRQDGGKSISGYVELDQTADNVRLSVLDATRVKSLMPWTSVLRCLVKLALIGMAATSRRSGTSWRHIFQAT